MSRYSYNVRVFVNLAVESDSPEKATDEVKRIINSCVVPGSGLGLELDGTPELAMVDAVGIQSEVGQDM